MPKVEPKKRPGFVRVMVTKVPGKDKNGESIKPKPGKTTQISEARARDKNYLIKNGLVLMPEPMMPPTQPEPVTPMTPKVEPIKPTKVKIKWKERNYLIF